MSLGKDYEADYAYELYHGLPTPLDWIVDDDDRFVGEQDKREQAKNEKTKVKTEEKRKWKTRRTRYTRP